MPFQGAFMSRDKDFPEQKPVKVDWDDPDLQSLLRKTESWQLDKRRSFTPQDVRIHLRWSTGAARFAKLLDMHEDMMVLQTAFPLQAGEQVRVDRPIGESGTPLWGVVIRSRAGTRADESAQGAYLHWLRRADADD